MMRREQHQTLEEYSTLNCGLLEPGIVRKVVVNALHRQRSSQTIYRAGGRSGGKVRMWTVNPRSRRGPTGGFEDLFARGARSVYKTVGGRSRRDGSSAPGQREGRASIDRVAARPLLCGRVCTDWLDCGVMRLRGWMCNESRASRSQPGSTGHRRYVMALDAS